MVAQSRSVPWVRQDQDTHPAWPEPRSCTFCCGPPTGAEWLPDLVGGKAANLMRMARAGMPVPPGFVLTTRMCREFLEHGLPPDFSELLAGNLAQLEQTTGLKFGGLRRPLLVAVRSGSPVSMPGMMDTILNIGLCEHTVSPLVAMTGNARLAWDSYRRLVQSFGEVVHGLDAELFHRLVEEQVQRESVASAAELDMFALRELSRRFLELYAEHVGEPFPQNPMAQLRQAAEAVFGSWRNRRASDYRRLHGIPDDLGTAVTIQAMVFGNMGGTSGSGVAFTRDPATGQPELYLDFLLNAQGEDVVSGRHALLHGSQIRLLLPGIERQLRQVSRDLEHLFRDVQDFEFTVQEERLYLLQTRAAKRTPLAALLIACQLVEEGLISPGEALKRLAHLDLDSIQLVKLKLTRDHEALGAGVPACPGVAVGPIALDARTAVAMSADGNRPILVRRDISTDDLTGMAAAAGILTRLGGRTSHGAVIARQLNRVCIVGCPELVIERNRQCRIGMCRVTEGDFLSLDGHSGKIYAGRLEVETQRPCEELTIVARWRTSDG